MLKRKAIASFMATAVLLLAIGFIPTFNVVNVEATQWTGLSLPFSVAIGDYDDDGLNDIAFSTIGSPEKLFVYKSDGVTLIEQWTGLGNLRGVAIGDYDNDGSNDIAFAQTPSLGGGTVKVYKNDGVTLIAQWTGLYSPLFISIGDYDNDGLNDLAFTESYSDRVTVYNSDGTTIIEQWTGLVGHPVGVAIGDYDNDGLNDLAFTEFAGNVTVYQSDGVTIIKQWTGASTPYGVAIGDYDNDGLNDLAFSESDAGIVTVYKSDGVTITKQMTGLNSPMGIAIGDYNNDGLNDLALAEYYAGRVIVYYATEVSVYPELITGPPPRIGGKFDVNITVSNVLDLYDWQAGLTFNASVLECTGITEGEFLTRAGVPTLWTPGTINNVAGTIGYSACSITGATPGVNGTGQLMCISFKVKGSGNSTLHITDALLLDSNLDPITPVSISDGHVEIHVQDVAILSVAASATEAYPTWIDPLNVTVVVENQGTRSETFDVSVYANLLLVGTKSVTLDAGANTTLIYSWNLAGVPEAHYSIRAEAAVLYGEIDTADNTLTDGDVRIKHPGDANGDDILNAYDLGMLAKAWGTSVGQPLYDARADFNGDETIDTLDHDILKAYWP